MSGYSLNRQPLDLCVFPRFAKPGAPQQRVRDYIIITPPKRITIAHIQEVVAEHYDIPRSEMVSKRRGNGVSHYRQLAMYLAKKHTPRSLPEIGRRFGGRDHTTVLYAIKRVEKRIRENADVEADIRAIEELL